MTLFDEETEVPTLNDRITSLDGLRLVEGAIVRLTIRDINDGEEGMPASLAVALWFEIDVGPPPGVPDLYVKFENDPPTELLTTVGPNGYCLVQQMRDGIGLGYVLGLAAQHAYTPVAKLKMSLARKGESVDLFLEIGPHWHSQKRIRFEKLKAFVARPDVTAVAHTT